MRMFSSLLVRAAMLTAVAALIWASWPGRTKPWWYNDSQLGWEVKHALVPRGYDDVSDRFIHAYGVSASAWDRSQMWTYVGDASTRYQWIDDRLLMRSLDGRLSPFSGGHGLHPPLKFDPGEGELQAALAVEDDGKVHFAQGGKSLVEALEESGAKVTR